MARLPKPVATLPQRLIAEALGTAGLLLFGTGAIVVNEQTQALGHGGTAAAAGLAVFLLIQAFGPISGSHLNPAVTVGFWAAGRMPGRLVLPYALAQVGGALAGSGLLRLLAPAGSMLGATRPAHGAAEALAVEAILTFWLVLVVLRVAHGSREQGLLAGLAIGATVGLEALVAGPLTGASMNPARSLAPALLNGQLAGIWLYVAGPLAGALLAVAVDKFLRLKPLPNPSES